MCFFQKKRKDCFFCSPLPYKIRGVKILWKTCAFKITTIFLNKPFVGDAIAKGI